MTIPNLKNNTNMLRTDLQNNQYLMEYITFLRFMPKNMIEFDRRHGGAVRPLCEKHHFIPKSWGGKRGDNLRYLTREEHMRAHYLFWKACQWVYGDTHEYTIGMFTAWMHFKPLTRFKNELDSHLDDLTKVLVSQDGKFSV